jgi:hypothetical protein
MPGRRNLARERAQHDAAAHFQHYHALLTAAFPDRALIGSRAILAYLGTFQVRRLNGDPVTNRTLWYWRRRAGFPLLRGFNNAGRRLWPMVSSTHAVSAWLLAQFANGEPRVGLGIASDDTAERNFATTLRCEHCGRFSAQRLNSRADA